MNPKQKAIELYNKFYKWYPKQDAEFIAIECAKIATEEIIKEYGTYYKIEINNKYVSYWNEVKKEIEKL